MPKPLSTVSALNNLEKPTLADYDTNITSVNTTEEDGTMLYVLNKASHSVVGYKVAFEGEWYDI